MPLTFRDDRRSLGTRIDLSIGGLVLVFFFLAASYWNVQVRKGDEYYAESESNRLRPIPLKAPRGMIVDRQGRLLTQNNPSYNLVLERERTRDPEASLEYVARGLGIPLAEVAARYAEGKHLPSFQPLLLAEDLTLAHVALFETHALEHPEIRVEVGHKRFYREGNLAAHALGYLGEVTREQIATSGGAYQLGDIAGQKGVEAIYDRRLRGTDGERMVVVDSHGRVIRRERDRPPKLGENLYLALDLDLQRIAEDFFATQAGTTGAGACVALDPRNGEVLVMVSAPSFDPNLFAHRFSGAEWAALANDPLHPLQNRAIQSTYSPGSVFKIVMSLAAMEEGYSPTTGVYCGGGGSYYNHYYRCWKKGGHGTVAMRDAIKHSCDVYFYTLGRWLGIERIAKYAHKVMLGHDTGIDLPSENEGLVPTPAWSLKKRGHQWFPGETISVSIGQGPLLVTPTQMAVATAVIANGGSIYRPRLAYRFQDPVTGEFSATKPELVGRVALPPAALARLRDGMWAVVNEGGTGTRGAAPGLDIAGKTGTVQVVKGAGLKSERLPQRHRDHGWFTAFAPRDKPQIVVVVFLENGNHGYYGATLTRDIMEKHFQKLGLYQPPDPATRYPYPVQFPPGTGPSSVDRPSTAARAAADAAAVGAGEATTLPPPPGTRPPAPSPSVSPSPAPSPAAASPGAPDERREEP